ncbi:tetratricopeptide (TPR) repeat protein [Dysgonomonas sp. PH5-45]|uniref:tetratricopeptide repeat protein n=1 Tax=unclassified Dysgonomonas TaxID=2630389 RepID=UPI0024761374|nr:MULTISPECIES: tetratricopeptide repeat protein [unclassified Dysgonomonas]MDH6354104.1 tetratricopeptide (TPR) repeat protein [Dysgonomonas sp. PH5-45]MDH6387045.1 tetratricopeptide (TPR) repeat protein [Dysgonomonas sp. PH5-37]
MKKSLFIFIPLLFFSSFTLSQTYEELVLKSADYAEKGDYLSAEIALLQALRAEPANAGNTLLLSNLGTIQRKLGKQEEALLAYNTALSKNHNVPSILHNRAVLYCEMRRDDDAMKDYDSILFYNENDILARYRRGLLHINQNDIPAARKDFDKIEEIEPNNIMAQQGHALAFKHLNQWNDAEKIYTNLIGENKGLAKLYFDRAECYLNTRKFRYATDDLNKAQSLGFESPELYIMRGQIRLEQYDKLAAKKDFEKAKELGAEASFIDRLINLCK